jgi:hypothetical protein
LLSKKTLLDEDEGETSELKYLSVIRDVREGSPDLFEKIKRLPKKARSGKAGTAAGESLVTYFRKGKLHKFYGAGGDSAAQELDFVRAAEALRCVEDEGRAKMPPTYFDLLDRNKLAFSASTTADAGELQARPSGDSGAKIQRILKVVFKNTKQLTDDQEAYVKKVQSQLEKGALPRQTTKVVLHSLNALKADLANPLKVLAVLQAGIPSGLLGGHLAEDFSGESGKREVILSMYMAGDTNE